MEKPFRCECCNYNSKTKAQLQKHFTTAKHQIKTEEADPEYIKEKEEDDILLGRIIYKCECCKYETYKKCNFLAHNKSNKHLKIADPNYTESIYNTTIKKIQDDNIKTYTKYLETQKTLQKQEKTIRQLNKNNRNIEKKLKINLKEHNKRINIRGFIKKNDTKPITKKIYKKIQADLKDMTIRFNNQVKYNTQHINRNWKLKSHIKLLQDALKIACGIGNGDIDDYKDLLGDYKDIK
jgi:hypothetical protein